MKRVDIYVWSFGNIFVSTENKRPWCPERQRGRETLNDNYLWISDGLSSIFASVVLLDLHRQRPWINERQLDRDLMNDNYCWMPEGLDLHHSILQLIEWKPMRRGLTPPTPQRSGHDLLLLIWSTFDFLSRNERDIKVWHFFDDSTAISNPCQQGTIVHT